MLTEKQIESFNANGYLLVTNVLSKKEIEFLRSRILLIFETDEWKKSIFNTNKVLSDVYQTFPEFIDITINSKILTIVKSLLGEKPILMPETAIHYKFYTGWHKDTTSQERVGHSFHKTSESLMIEAGFYLQDNDEYGGGLTVMPGSHLTSDIFVNPNITKWNIYNKIKNKLGLYREEKNNRINPHKHKIVDIKSKAGDMVVFNFKTNHRATLPKVCKPSEVPKHLEKLAFFNAYSRNNETANEYIKYINSRPEPFYKYLVSRKPNEALITKAETLNLIVY